MQEQQNPKERNLDPTTEPAEIRRAEFVEARRAALDEATGWKRWLNYQSIVRQVPFFLFLSLLAVIYIYNGHFADKMIRGINRLSREVKELQYEYKSVKSEVMFRSKESELVKAVEPLGLKELTTSPVVLSAD